MTTATTLDITATPRALRQATAAPARSWNLRSHAVLLALSAAVLALAFLACSSPERRLEQANALRHSGDARGALAEYKAPENYPSSACPLCQSGVPITAF
mgnify:CR=1 FL=1